MFKQLSFCTAALLLAGTITMHAQEKKNLIGGSIGYYANKSKSGITDLEPKSNSFSANLMYAYYLRSKLALGLKVSTLNSRSEYVNGAPAELFVNKNNRTTLSPFVRYDVPLWNSRFGIYNDLGIGITFGRADLETNNQDLKDFGLTAFYEPGLQFRINSHVALQASFGNLFSANYYTSKDELSDYETKSTNIGIDGRFGISSFLFGVNFFF